MKSVLECSVSGHDRPAVERMIKELADVVQCVDGAEVRTVPVETPRGMFESVSIGSVIVTIVVPVALGVVSNAISRWIDSKATNAVQSAERGSTKIQIGSVQIVVYVTEKDK